MSIQPHLQNGVADQAPKKTWSAPVLRRLDVRQTENFTSVPGSNDGQVDCS